MAGCTCASPRSVAALVLRAGLTFPDSGEYIVPGALNPISADVERDEAEYVEPNVWMHHRLV